MAASFPELRLAIVDDLAGDLELNDQMAQEILREASVPCSTDRFDGADELLSALEKGREYQIFLLDVHMPGMDGVALAANLRARGVEAPIVFISRDREMALRGYEVSAARYLEKPVKREKLREALLHCCHLLDKGRGILINTDHGQLRLPAEEILYAETWGRGIRIAHAGGYALSSLPISEFAAMLPQRQFIFCHRAYLVNLAHVSALRYGEIDLDNGQTLAVSKYSYAEVKRMYQGYLSE